MIWGIIVLAVYFAGNNNGGMDSLQFRNPWFKKYDWLNPLKSWMFKWKNKDGVRIVEQSAPWYYLFIYNPSYKEKFWYSSTALVFLTDGWHFFKWLMFLCYEIPLTCLIIDKYFTHVWWYYPCGVLILQFIRFLGFTTVFRK